jgi:hypothetical protein
MINSSRTGIGLFVGLILVCLPLALLANDNLVSAPKWLDHPALDGKPTDPAYLRAHSKQLSGPSGIANPEIRAFHSGRDLFVGISHVPFSIGARHIVVLIDPNNRRDHSVGPGVLRFEVTPAGEFRLQIANSEGSFRSVLVSKDSVEVAVANEDHALWSAELRVALDLLGGYARTVRLGLWITGQNEAVKLSWPSYAADASSPMTWGTLVLEPTYVATTAAGSLFLDGQNSYLAVPHTEELASSDVTVETWIRLASKERSTILENVGAGYCLVVDGVIEWSRAHSPLRRGKTLIDAGWHHVAVTEDHRGNASIYIDGRLDARFAGPLEEARGQAGMARSQPLVSNSESGRAERSVSAEMFMRIGARSKQAASGSDYFHGNLAELRIWNRVRTEEELTRDAFAHLSGNEPGLIGLWPFTHDLEDRAHRHYGGLIGSASLALAGPDVDSFPPPIMSQPVVSRTSPRASRPSWDGTLRTSLAPIKIDGIPRPDEYDDAPALPLEPGISGMKMVLTPKGLALSTNILSGSPGGEDAVTVYIGRDGHGGGQLGRTDLRLTLWPNARLEVAEGGREGFQRAQSEGIRYQAISYPFFNFDDQIVRAPWWSGEVFVPIRTLSPFQAGDPMRIAVRLRGSVPSDSIPGTDSKKVINAVWPAEFDPNSPETWALLKTTDSLVGESEASSSIALSSECPAPVRPTANQFMERCDGGVFKNEYLWNKDAKWPDIVQGGCPSFVRAEGTLHDITISHEDAIAIHGSHDLDMHMDLAIGNEWTLLDGDTLQVLESESGKFDRRALPNVGEHLTVYGEWIFDCGHAPKTEIHPIPVLETDRKEHRIVWPGGDLTMVTAVRLWITDNPGTWTYPGLLGGTYEFIVELPPSPGSTGIPFVRLAQGPKGTLERATLELLAGPRLRITLQQPEAGYHEIYAGFLYPGMAQKFTTYTIQPGPIHVKDDHDGWSRGDGEWYMLANINGQWRTIFWNRKVDDGKDEGYALPWSPTKVIDLYGSNLKLQVIGYEDDDDGDNPGGKGDEFSQNTSGSWDLGSLATLAQSKHTFTKSDWAFDYFVGTLLPSSSAGIPNVFSDKAYWKPRVMEEVVGNFDLGQIKVPAPNAPANQLTHDAYLLRDLSVRQDGTKLVAPDKEDRYWFSFSDFADATVSVSGGVDHQLEWDDPWYWKMPESLKEILGYKSAVLKVFAPPDIATDRNYTLMIQAKYRVLPPDPGEPLDETEYRLVDLRTPDPKVKVTKITRTLTTDWAWQHVANDVDVYRILIPKPLAGQSIVAFACPYSHLERLEIDAPGMSIYLPPTGVIGLGPYGLGFPSHLTVEHLSTDFPEGEIIVVVRNPTSTGRGAYQLTATWTDHELLDLNECAAIDALKLESNTVPVDGIHPLPEPDPLTWTGHVNSSSLGVTLPIRSIPGTALEILAASEGGFPIRARLYTKSHVLVTEGSATEPEGHLANMLSSDLFPQQLLITRELQRGEDYSLELTPTTAGSSRPTSVRIGAMIRSVPR